MTRATSIAVAVSIAVSIATSIGGAVAGATGTAAGVGAAGVGGAAGGGIAPLLWGAQRFSLTNGLAVEKSEVHSGVAGSLGWISGELPISDSVAALHQSLLGGGSTSGRRLSEQGLSRDQDGIPFQPEVSVIPQEVETLYNTLTSFGIGIGLTFAGHLILVLLWRCVINRRQVSRSLWLPSQAPNSLRSLT